MNEFEGILKEIDAQGIQLKTDGKNLYYKPKQEITERIREQLAANKAEIIHFLRLSRKVVVVYSHVLNRKIVLSWNSKDPKVIYVDRTPYSKDEIAKLKGADPKTIQTAHLLKEKFNGTILDQD